MQPTGLHCSRAFGGPSQSRPGKGKCGKACSSAWAQRREKNVKSSPPGWGELLFWQREKDSTSAAAEAGSRGKRAPGTFSNTAPVRILLNMKRTTRPNGQIVPLSVLHQTVSREGYLHQTVPADYINNLLGLYLIIVPTYSCFGIIVFSGAPRQMGTSGLENPVIRSRPACSSSRSHRRSYSGRWRDRERSEDSQRRRRTGRSSFLLRTGPRAQILPGSKPAPCR